MFLFKKIQKKEYRKFISICVLIFIFISFLGNNRVFAQETTQNCPGPTEGRVGGTDPEYSVYKPDGTEDGEAKTELLFCPGSPNLLSCDNGFEYSEMDGDKMTFLRPLSTETGPLTVTCADDTGEEHTYEIEDQAVREDHECEEVTTTCKEDEDTETETEAEVAVEDLSRIIAHSGGGGIVLRDENRESEEALVLNDLNLKFSLVDEGTDTSTDELSCDDITWLDADICDWEISSPLEVYTEGGSIIFDQTLTSDVESVYFDDHDMAGNTWVVVKLDGTWYASTFEWLPEGETQKFLDSVSGEHTQKSPEIPEDWVPEEGDELYFFVSSLIRMGEMNGQFRTPIVKYVWGSEEHGGGEEEEDEDLRLGDNVCKVTVDGEEGAFTRVGNSGRTIYNFNQSGGHYCLGGTCEVELTDCPNEEENKTYEFVSPGESIVCPTTDGGLGSYEEGEFLWRAMSERDCNLEVTLPSVYTLSGAVDGDTPDTMIAAEGSGEITNLVEITFKGDTEVDLSFDYTNFNLTAKGKATVRNIVKGTSKLLFDVTGDSGDTVDVQIKGLGVYITNGRAKDSEQLKITFNEIDYFGDNFFIDTFTEYCDGIGRFAGSTGLNGTFKIGDSLTYIPLASHNGQEYYLDLSQLDIPGLTPLGEEVIIAEGNLDKIDTTFPLIEERRDTGEYLYTCMTSPISIDNKLSDFGEDVGSFSGQTGANNTYRIGDNLVYHGPYPKDGDTYVFNGEILGGGEKEPSETEFKIEEGTELDDDQIVLNITATDNAGNEVVFVSPIISVDTIRPEFSPEDFISNGEFIELFIPQSKIDDPRYKGFSEKFGIEKEIWGNGDHLRVLMPEDDLKDDGDPLVSVDFSDISTAGNLVYVNNPTELEMNLDVYYDGLYTNVSEIAGFVDTLNYSKVIKYTDDAGNEPTGETEIKTNEVGIDMVGPQIPNPPPSYSSLEIMVNKIIATIGTEIKLITPEEDIRSESLRFSTNLSEIGGTIAEFLFEKGDQEFTIEAGEVQAGEDYNRVIYYFDKAFNLLEQEIDKIIVDNKVATFDTSCGATFKLINKEDVLVDYNQIADITNDGADELIFTSPDNSIEGCDLTSFSIDFTSISEKPDLADVYEQVSADGREIKIDIGQGSLDDTAKQLILKAYDQYGNGKDYLTGEFNIDNEITTRQMLTDKIEFADFDTNEDMMYIGLGDDVKIEVQIAEMEDIVKVIVKIDGAINEYELTQDQMTPEQMANDTSNKNPWRGVIGLSPGNYQVEPKYITYIIIDDAGNRVELEGNQKIYISNKIPDFDGADGGTENLHRDGFKNGNPIRNRGDYLRNKEEFNKNKIAEYMSEAEMFEKKIKFLIEHGFELGPEEKAYLKARSLNRRLNYLEPKINKNHRKDVPSLWELMKDKLRISRKNVIEKQKEPRQMEKKIRALVDPKKQVKNWNKLVDREGGLHTQNTLKNLKSSAEKRKSKFKKIGTLRKTELYQRGKIGVIKR